MVTWIRRLGMALAVTQSAQWLLAGGLTAVLSVVGAVVLRIVGEFEWWLFGLTVAGVAMIVSAAVLAFVSSGRELRLISMRTGEFTVRDRGDGVWARTMTAYFFVTNLSDQRSIRLLRSHMKRPKLDGWVTPYPDDNSPADFKKTGWLGPHSTGAISCTFSTAVPNEDVHDASRTSQMKSRIVLVDNFARRHVTGRVRFLAR